MNATHALRQIAAAALLSVVGAAAAFGLAAGTAAATYGAGEGAIDALSNYEWCPGDPIMQSDNKVTWDWNTCHLWHYESPTAENPSVYWVVEGLRPNPCPPIAFMCP
jgi:hypothetical protein